MAADEIVVTLVAAHGFSLSDIVRSKENFPLSPSRIVWLEENHAIDAYYPAQDIKALWENVREFVRQHPIDVFVQSVANRKKRVFVADMESTIIQQEMLDELADFVGARKQVEEITKRAMNGEIDFAAALQQRVALLKGQPESILEEVAERMTPMVGVEPLMHVLKGAGIQCWLVSGGFNFFVRDVADRLGFDASYANELVVHDGVLTGEVELPILDKTMKKKLLERACDDAGCGLAASITIGDGANDIPMLEACAAGGGLAIAYHAKPKVRDAIMNQINHGDLSALVYVLG